VPGSVCRGGFSDVAGNHRGVAPTVFLNIQWPTLNVQCPSFLGGGLLVLGLDFPDFAGTHKGHPYKIRFFLTSGADTQVCPYGFEFRLPTVYRGFLYRVLDVFALGRSAVLSVLVAGLLVVPFFGLWWLWARCPQYVGFWHFSFRFS